MWWCTWWWLWWRLWHRLWWWCHYLWSKDCWWWCTWDRSLWCPWWQWKLFQTIVLWPVFMIVALLAVLLPCRVVAVVRRLDARTAAIAPFERITIWVTACPIEASAHSAINLASRARTTHRCWHCFLLFFCLVFFCA